MTSKALIFQDKIKSVLDSAYFSSYTEASDVVDKLIEVVDNTLRNERQLCAQVAVELLIGYGFSADSSIVTMVRDRILSVGDR